MLRQVVKLVASGAMLALAAVGAPLLASAESEPGQAVSASPEAKQAPEAKPAKKVVVKRKKGRRKSAKSVQSEPENMPGDKLTVKQIAEIIKTSRDLSGKNLNGLQLAGMNLSKCNLKGADLSHANLERADLSESNLERADLTGANLRMASLRQSGMIAANLELAIFDGAIWKDGSICAKGSVGQCRMSAPVVPANPAPSNTPAGTSAPTSAVPKP